MFPKEHRYSFRGGVPKQAFSTPFFVFRFELNTGGSYTGAVVVSKKVEAKATARNRTKRRYVRILRDILQKKAYTVNSVIYMRKAGLQITDDQVREILLELLQKVYNKK